MKNKIIILSLVFLLFLIPLMNATESYIFKQDVESTLEIPVFNNDLTKCLTCSCEITINYPNGTNAVRSDTTTLVNNYISYPLSGKFVSVLGTYKSDVYCTNGADYGISTFEYEVTGNGKALPSGGVIVLFILAFLVLLGLLVYMMIYSIGHLINLDFDIVDLAYNLGVYFVVWGLYLTSMFYLGNNEIESWFLLAIQIGAFTHVLIPFVALIISLTVGSMMKKKLNIGRGMPNLPKEKRFKL